MTSNRNPILSERLQVIAKNYIFIEIDSTSKKKVLAKLEEMGYAWQSKTKPLSYIPNNDIKYLALSLDKKNISMMNKLFLEENDDILGESIICSGDFLENPYKFLQENNNPVISR